MKAELERKLTAITQGTTMLENTTSIGEYTTFVASFSMVMYIVESLSQFEMLEFKAIFSKSSALRHQHIHINVISAKNAFGMMHLFHQYFFLLVLLHLAYWYLMDQSI